MTVPRVGRSGLVSVERTPCYRVEGMRWAFRGMVVWRNAMSGLTAHAVEGETNHGMGD